MCICYSISDSKVKSSKFVKVEANRGNSLKKRPKFTCLSRRGSRVRVPSSPFHRQVRLKSRLNQLLFR